MADSGVLGGVLEEIAKKFIDPDGVGTDQGQGGGELDGDLVIGEPGGVFGDGFLDDGAEGVWGDAHVDLLGVELSHLDCVGDELVEAVALFIDDGEELVGDVGGELRGEEGADGGFDGGERGA